MGMLQEFREFAVKGNAMDLAVGVIIGGAFGKIVDSIVGDLVMPLVSRVTGRLDFSNLFFVLGDNPKNLTALADIKTAGIPVFAYGSFLTILVNFVILAFVIFMMVKQLNRLRNEEPGGGTRSPGNAGRRDAAARDSRFAEEVEQAGKHHGKACPGRNPKRKSPGLRPGLFL